MIALQTLGPIRKQTPRLLSTSTGEIRQILLTQSGFQTPWSDLRLRAIRETFEKEGIETITLVNDQNRRNVYEPFESIDLDNRRLLQMLCDNRDLQIFAKFDPAKWHQSFDTIQDLGLPFAQSQWAQDPFCVMANAQDEKIFLLQSIYANRIEDQFVSLELALESSVNAYLKPSTLQIEGGNVLAGDDFVLVGLDTLAINWIEHLKQNAFEAPSLTSSIAKPRSSEELSNHLVGLRKTFQLTFNVPEVLWVGFPLPRLSLMGQQKYVTLQPLYHLDLFLTLAGKTKDGTELILVGDPRLGKEIASSIGSQVDSGLFLNGSPISDDQIFSYFDEIATWFQQYNLQAGRMRKFNVIRLPMLIQDGVVYSFNNSLVDTIGSSKRIFVPNYISDSEEKKGQRHHRLLNEKMEALQTAVASTLTAAGFEHVIWTGNGEHMQNFAVRQGSLRCMSKVLRRD